MRDLARNTIPTYGLQAILLVVIACLASSTLLAQVTSGTIFGSVTDQTGAIVTTAKVTVRSAATGVTREVTVSESGSFVASDLPPRQLHHYYRGSRIQATAKNGGST
jgi:hypothetical protein